MIETFSALFIAHVASDFIFQSRWIALNKGSVLPMAAHIGIVALTSWVALGFSSVLAVAILTAIHLAMDTLKTRSLGKTGLSYGIDQGVHLITILIIAYVFPGAWAQGIWANAAPETASWVLLAGVLAMGAVFATRGGLFFVDHLLTPNQCPDCAWAAIDSRAHRRARIERAAVFAGLILAPELALIATTLRLIYVTWQTQRGHYPQDILTGTVGSDGWAVLAGLGTVITLRSLAALDAAQAAHYPMW